MSKLSFIAIATLQLSCSPLEPDLKPPPQTSSKIVLAFNTKNLNLDEEKPRTIRVRVFFVKDDQRYKQEGEDIFFKFNSEQNQITLSQLQIGLKEIEISIINDQGEVIGSGFFRHIIKEGDEVLEKPVIIEIHKREIRRQNLNLLLNYTLTEDPITTYQDIKPIFKKYDCISCHDNSQLNLTAFPFVFDSQKFSSQEKFVQEMIQRISSQDANKMMPPSWYGDKKVSAEDIEKMNQWLQDKLPKSISDSSNIEIKKIVCRYFNSTENEVNEWLIDGYGKLNFTLENLIADGKYNFIFEFYIENNIIIHSEQLENQLIHDENLELNFDIKVKRGNLNFVVIY